MEASNVQKMREALETVVKVGYPHNFQREAPHIREYCYDITEAIKKCFAALSAPPRQCDVGTAKEQWSRFEKMCFSSRQPDDPDYCSCKCKVDGGCVNDCALIWAQMPYGAEEGGAE